MPRKKEINHKVSNDLYSLQIYDPTYFINFNSAHEFTKWALMEVSDLDSPPPEMETFTLEGGLYAVFHYQGSSDNRKIFQFIFTEWLPQSEFYLDSRPHFEVLGDRYKNADENSEEEIWIPIKPKA